jgi:hypothetical protein
MVESPFLQQIVRLYAYEDFRWTVARYYQEASQQNQQHVLLFDGYMIFRDRWPASDYSPTHVCSSLSLSSELTTNEHFYQFYEKVRKATFLVNPVCLGPHENWFDKFNMQEDRRNRVSFYLLVYIIFKAFTNKKK